MPRFGKCYTIKQCRRTCLFSWRSSQFSIYRNVSLLYAIPFLLSSRIRHFSPCPQPRTSSIEQTYRKNIEPQKTIMESSSSPLSHKRLIVCCDGKRPRLQFLANHTIGSKVTDVDSRHMDGMISPCSPTVLQLRLWWSLELISRCIGQRQRLREGLYVAMEHQWPAPSTLKRDSHSSCHQGTQ